MSQGDDIDTFSTAAFGGAGFPAMQDFYAGLGIDCVAVEAMELTKAAGAIGCLSGILAREPAA
jgi:hypothetical protein